MYKISLQMLKTVNMLDLEEIAAITTTSSLIKDSSVLLMRCRFYLKLKSQQQRTVLFALQKLTGEEKVVPDIGEEGNSKKIPEGGGEGYTVTYTMSVTESEEREEGCASKKRKLSAMQGNLNI